MVPSFRARRDLGVVAVTFLLGILLYPGPLLRGEIFFERDLHLDWYPRLEALSPPEKHLLRMGPRNVQRVQAKLREVSAALESAMAPPDPTPAASAAETQPSATPP